MCLVKTETGNAVPKTKMEVVDWTRGGDRDARTVGIVLRGFVSTRNDQGVYLSMSQFED
jgi:hypothetical protein